jgi:ProP effector
MNPTVPETPAPSPAANEPRAPRQNRRGGASRRGQAPGNSAANKPAQAAARQHPVLDQLAALYPALFGEHLLPLKRGIYQDLLAAQPDALPADGLKAALALHTRSTRYLNTVAAGLARHDLGGQPVEAPTPEQVHHALIEVFRRRGSRSREDLRPELRQRILKAFEASGLTREAYAECVLGRDDEVNQLTQDALQQAALRAARDEALLRAFEASGKTLETFADMYGLLPMEATQQLDRARAERTR